MYCTFDVIPKNSLPNLIYLLLCLYNKHFIVFAPTLGIWSTLSRLMYMMLGRSLIFFTGGCSFCLAPFVEKTFLSPLSCLGSFVEKSNDHTYKGSFHFLDFQFCLIDYFMYLSLYLHYIFMLVPHYLGYSSKCWNWEVWVFQLSYSIPKFFCILWVLYLYFRIMLVILPTEKKKSASLRTKRSPVQFPV